MKYRGIFEYEYSTEHKPPVSIDVHLHGDCVKGKIIEWEYRLLEQEPKTGHWYIDERPESDREVICSNCEQPIFKYHKMDFDYRPNHCPNCGARMIDPQESEEV